MEPKRENKSQEIRPRVAYELVCVSAIEAQFEVARLQNLHDCGILIARVVATNMSATTWRGLIPGTRIWPTLRRGG